MRRASVLWWTLMILAATSVLLVSSLEIGQFVYLRAQLQTIADAAATAAAAHIDADDLTVFSAARRQVEGFQVEGEQVHLAASDVQVGIWDAETRNFIATTRPGNAVCVTVRCRPRHTVLVQSLLAERNDGFLAPTASAVAIAAPRDIALVVDTSRSSDTARGALMSALEVIERRNAAIPNLSQRDWVSIVTFNALTEGGPTLDQPLTADYAAARRVCKRLASARSNNLCRATEAALLASRRHLSHVGDEGRGRANAGKIVVLLTHGLPDEFVTDLRKLQRYQATFPNENFYGDEQPAANAALVQAHLMETSGWRLYPLPLSPEADADFLARLARIGGGVPLAPATFAEIFAAPQVAVVR